MADEASTAGMPTQAQMLLERPLYSPLTVKGQTGWLKVLRQAGFQFDAYCVFCKDKSPFHVIANSAAASSVVVEAQVTKSGYFTVTARCSRHGHGYIYYFRLMADNLEKVGQYPSMEDIVGADIEKYRAQLRGGAFAELRKATGLASHGIGIGAFVYLRRIFERLIYEHRDQLETKNGPIEHFDKMRMDEKISALKAVLPAALVKHRAAYAILSKGLHELTEDECKIYFPVVRAAIIQMLEEDWIERERKRAEKSLEQELQRIAAEVNRPPAPPKTEDKV